MNPNGIVLEPQAAQQLNDMATFLSFKPTWIWKQSMFLPHRKVCWFSGNQCLSGDSLIYDPVSKMEREVQLIQSDFHVFAWDGEKVVTAKALKPFRKEKDWLYDFELSDGSKFTASLGHKVLTPDGWKSCGELLPGSHVSLPRSNSGISPSIHDEGALHYSKTGQDSRFDCPNDLHFYDEPLLFCQENDRCASPSQVDAPGHKEPFSQHVDDEDCRCIDNLLQSSVLLSSLGAPTLSLDHVFGSLSRSVCTDSTRTYEVFLDDYRRQRGFSSQTRSEFSTAQSANLSTDVPLTPPLDYLTVTSIVKNRFDHKWDFTVPGYHNYILANAIHHNTGKTAGCIYSYVCRVFSVHPIPKKNVFYFECSNQHFFTRPAPAPILSNIFKLKDGWCFWNGAETKWWPREIQFPLDLRCPHCGEDLKLHQRGSTTMRFCSEVLPGDKEGTGNDSVEVKNRTYPELKKWLPPFLMKRDITFRNFAMIVLDPCTGMTFGAGDRAVNYVGKDIVFEFVAYSQTVQAGAGQQRMAVYADEEPPYAHYEEQLPRLLAEDGDFQLGLTPANRTTWTFDELFENAELFIRTPSITEFYKRTGENNRTDNVEHTGKKTGIAVLQAATDDNPTLNKEIIPEILNYTDEDTEATRRYGIHRQASGRIFKDFSRKIHVIDGDKYFPHGIPHFWTHARGIDFHPHVAWHCGCTSLSPQNEMFIWFSMAMSPDKYTTLEIMESFISATQEYKFNLNLIDPLAEATRKDTISVLDDIRRITIELKRNGIGEGGYWKAWNTKGDFGRENIKLRLKNARLVGRPFNNKQVSEGRTKHLPTIWVLKGNPVAEEHLHKWAWDQWSDSKSQITKDDKDTPQQKYSHMNMVWEAILKSPSFKPQTFSPSQEQRIASQYFNSKRG